jgi:hypothetical protein
VREHRIKAVAAASALSRAGNGGGVREKEGAKKQYFRDHRENKPRRREVTEVLRTAVDGELMGALWQD